MCAVLSMATFVDVYYYYYYYYYYHHHHDYHQFR
jgi:hypothetical protein